MAWSAFGVEVETWDHACQALLLGEAVPGLVEAVVLQLLVSCVSRIRGWDGLGLVWLRVRLRVWSGIHDERSQSCTSWKS